MSVVARAVVRWWPLVLAGWGAAVIAAVVLAPPFAEVAAFGEAAFLPSDSRAARGEELVAQGWPDQPLTGSLTVAAIREEGPLRPRDEAYVERLVAWLDGPAAPDAFGELLTHLRQPDLRDALVSADNQAMLVVVGLEQPAYSPAAREAVTALQDHLAAQPGPDGLATYVTGAAAVAVDENQAIEVTIARTQVLTVILVVGLLVWVFRSALAPLVPLVTVGAAYLVARGAVAALAEAGMDVSYLFEAFAIVIVFGAGTDYSLLIMSRYGEELGLSERRGHPTSRLLRGRVLTATMAVLGGVVASSAASTIVGFSSLSVAQFGLFRTLGPALALTVALTLVAGLTITPALVRLLGSALFWPNRLAWGVPGTGAPLVSDVQGREDAGETRPSPREDGVWRPPAERGTR